MNQNKLTFESEKLVVDWIGFNIQGSGNVKLIANYLFQKFHFNSTIVSGGTEKALKYDHRNTYSVTA